MYNIDPFLELKDSYVSEVFEYYEKTKELKKYIDIVTYIEKLVTDIANFKETFEKEIDVITYNGTRKYNLESLKMLRDICDKYDIKKVGSCSACDEMQKEMEELAYDLIGGKMGENDDDYSLDDDEDDSNEL